MTDLVTRSGAWLLQSAALPDTVFMVSPARGRFETVTGISSVVIAITLVLFVIVGAPAAWQVWQAINKTRALVEKAYADVHPLAVNARALADRLGELNALLTVFQDEAERALVSTAAAVRGVQTGAAALGGMDDADDQGEDDDGDDESDEEPFDEYERQQLEDSDRSELRPAARPRLRSRRPRE